MLKLLIFFAFFLSFFLTGCAAPHGSHFKNGRTKENYASSFNSSQHRKNKNPYVIALYDHQSHIKRPYRIIGKKIISRHHSTDLKKQETLKHLMKKVAAAMGGDAVVNIREDGQKIEGTIISYEQVLL